mgnify:FL=1
MLTSLSKNGYKIKKSDLTPKVVKEIKDELSVKPHSFNRSQNNDSSFQVFLESPKKLYLPRFYGIKRFGVPTELKMEQGTEINIEFNGDLRPEQKPIEEIY